MKLHEKIKQLRKKHSWSQADLGKKLGIHGGHISRLENGKFHPSLEILKRLAQTFGVTVDYLVIESVIENEELQEVKIQDESLGDRIRLLNTIDGKDKETIIHIIDTILTKRKMVELISKELSQQGVISK